MARANSRAEWPRGMRREKENVGEGKKKKETPKYRLDAARFREIAKKKRIVPLSRGKNCCPPPTGIPGYMLLTGEVDCSAKEEMRNSARDSPDCNRFRASDRKRCP